MKIINTDFGNHIIKSVSLELGNMYFLNNIAVIEFTEGVHVEIKNTKNMFKELTAFFGTTQPFGIVANRVNSYSVKLLDIPAFRDNVKNMSAYAVVGHDPAGLMNAAIESNFCLSEDISFDNIYEAIFDVDSKVKKTVLKILH